MKNLMKNVLVNISLFSFFLTILPMEPAPDKYTFVSFQADDGIVHIEKQNIPLIGTLYERYDLYLKSRYKNQRILIPLLKGSSKEEILLVNNALNVRPDEFSTYFKQLEDDQRDKLLKSSMIFSKDGKKIGLHVPEITKRILSICLRKDVYNNVMKFFPNKEKDDLIFHCRSALIKNKSRMGIVKQPRVFDISSFQVLDLQTLFINGYFSDNTIKQPIPLPLGNEIYKTYAYNFVSSHLEYRITELLKGGNPSDYLLWIIDHKNPTSTSSQHIQHSSPIIGCCFSKTKTNIEYVITYSENDIIFSTISMFKDGVCEVKTIRVDTSNKGKNVTAVYCQDRNQVITGMYQGTDNVFMNWTMDGIESSTSSWPFETYGLLKKIILNKNDLYNEQAFLIFSSCGMHEIHKFQNLGNHPWAYVHRSGLTSLINVNNLIFSCTFQKNNEVFMYDYSASSFSAIEEAEKQKQQQSSWFQGLINDFNFMPDNDCHKKYSSSGEFVLSNSLHKESGILYVKTEILDSLTHKPLLSLDTVYKNFAGVGLDDEEKKLIFIHHFDKNAEVSLWDEQDKKDMKWFKKQVLQNLGTVSVMTRLLEEIKKKNEIVLKRSDPLCTMLRDWVEQSPDVLSFMKKCFPMRVIKG